MKKRFVQLGMGLLVAVSLTACGQGGKTYTQEEVDAMLAAAAQANSASEAEGEEENGESIVKDNVENDSTGDENINQGGKSDSDEKDANGSTGETDDGIDFIEKGFSTEATIEETVLVDEKDIKITAKELRYSGGSADLTLMVENNKDIAIKVNSGYSGSAGNSINSYMTSELSWNEEIAPGKSIMKKVSINEDELRILGINEIAEMEMAFEITDEDYDTILETDACKLRTSVADLHDDVNESITKMMKGKAITKLWSIEVEDVREDIDFNEFGAKILSCTKAKNRSGDHYLIFDVLNESERPIAVRCKDICYNDVKVSYGTWDGEIINPGKKCVLTVRLDSVCEEEILKMLGIDSIASFGANFSVSDKNNDEPHEKYVEFKYGDYKADATSYGTEILNEKGVRLLSLGKRKEPTKYSPSAEMYFLLENNTDDYFVADLDYSGNSVNGFMTSLSCSMVGLEPGQVGLFEVKLYNFNFDECDISDADDIKEVGLALEVRGKNYRPILEQDVPVKYE